ncbi:MAG: OmpH family outer membrane protein [Pedobacter sp.]|uniref:OmpH family outer membrane protein n=1 Tax=Pedobacter sp. TaxID=1411316 RepID=UPI00280689CB|nr:OmpH family outer membrane protein [Pedobacter sp.]MDQ8006029.1 OmpH family outer membrane protein [Pedobacter sp.]
MKKNIPILVTLLFFAFQSKAQLAIVNGQKVIASMSEFAKIDTLVAKETAGYAAEYNKKQAALNKLVTQADSLYKLDAKAPNAIKAIGDAQTADKDLKAYGEMANKKIAEYKELLTKPYTEKVMAAIKTVALRGKYMQVLDSSTTSVLYLNPLADITDQVIKEIKQK